MLTHAIIDAMLGAAALGDIGEHFPDTDPRYAGVDSIELLRATRPLLAGAGLTVTHVDATVVLERPKLAPMRDAMRQRLAGGARAGPAPRQRQGHAWARGWDSSGARRGSPRWRSRPSRSCRFGRAIPVVEPL